jgi:hypothetical protein
VERLVGDRDLHGHRICGEAVDPRRQTLRDDRRALHRAARELDRVGRDVDQRPRRSGSEVSE